MRSPKTDNWGIPPCQVKVSGNLLIILPAILRTEAGTVRKQFHIHLMNNFGPILEYACEMWRNALFAYLYNQLKFAQRRLFRII